MACVAYADAAEVDGEDVEGCVGGALEDAREATHERVGTVCSHGVDHHATRSATRERLHESRGQRANEVGVAAQSLNRPLHAADEHIHSTRSTEHTDAHEYRHEIRDDAHSCRKAVLCALDERVVHVHLLAHTSQDEHHDDEHQQNVGHRRAHDVHLCLVHSREAPDDGGNGERQAAQREQHSAVEQVDALIERRDDDAGDGRTERSEQDRHEDVRRLRCAELRTIHHDAHRYERQTRRVEHEEHNHRVRRRVLLRVQLLQLLHSLQSERRCGVVEAEHVGSHIHKDAARDGMSFRNVGEQTREHGREHASQHVHHPTLLAYLHYAEPQREHAGESERNLERRARGVERRVHNCGEHFRIAHEHKPHKGYTEGNEEERNPDIVEYHSILCISFYSYLYISSICKITLLYRNTAETKLYLFYKI